MTLGVPSSSEMRLGFALGFIGFNVCRACGNQTMKTVVLNKLEITLLNTWFVLFLIAL